VIDYLHEKDEDIDDKNDATISKKERQYRERLRLTIGDLKTSSSKEQGITDNMYWSTDDNLRKLLRYRPSIQEMELILRSMCHLSKSKRLLDYTDNSFGRLKHFITLQHQLIEHFLEKYSGRSNRGESRNRGN
jgi:hypothetical protein